MAQEKRGELLVTKIIFSNEKLPPFSKEGWGGFKTIS